MDLRLHLTLRLALAALLSFALAASAALWRSSERLDGRSREAVQIAGKLIENRQIAYRSVGMSDGIPVDNLTQVLDPALSNGLCLRLVLNDASITTSCRGWDGSGNNPPPAWFARLLARWRGSRESERLLPGIGRVHASADPRYEATEAWREVGPMLGLAALMLVAIGTLSWFIIGRALRPTQQLLDTLAALEAGDLARRAPPFRLRELSRIGTGLDRLAASLQKSLAERAALAAELMRAQENERRHLARELHDEFGQALVGIAALVASIEHGAGAQSPDLSQRARRVGELNQRLRDQLASMLDRLRPPELDALGLAAALRALVGSWDAATGGGRCTLRLDGDFAGLPEPVSITAYRIVQEALTNIAKHGRAVRHVAVRVERPAAASELRIEIVDDGVPLATPPRPGHGLAGMRERVAALGGRLEVATPPSGGLQLRAALPLSPRPELTP